MRVYKIEAPGESVVILQYLNCGVEGLGLRVQGILKHKPCLLKNKHFCRFILFST